jgi:chloramphenicol O-acetyltransferase type A
MRLNIIDMQNYPRREHYEHFSRHSPCSFSLTANVDVTELVPALRSAGVRFYPAFIHVVATAVNRQPEFRMAVDQQGRLGYYDVVSPYYTVFHDDDETFSCISTPYRCDFAEFYRAVTADMDKFRDVKHYQAVAPPSNCFDVSCLPWLSYTGFNLNLPTGGNYYAPIITWGKYTDIAGRLQLPLTVQIDHAVADGYHVAMLFRDVNEICAALVESLR